jgi:cytochrome c-type biogenesis protein CcmE
MNRRTIRAGIALSLAVLLASALAWASFTASSQAVAPSALARDGKAGHSYQLTGKVLAGYHRAGDVLLFRVRDRSGPSGQSVLVRYTGAVPDPFRAGREILVTVDRRGASWVGERDSLITKCPSKFSAAKQTT